MFLKSDYELITLKETEVFINQHKHLHEIPSAKELEENGLHLKEMNLLLLKKVEEITLHLIRQQKEADEMRSQINALKNELQLFKNNNELFCI
jgi:hypothetical protein